MKLGVVAAVNDREVLETNLLRSPLIAEQGVPVQLEEGYVSASQAYNAGLRAIDADVVVFAHQDVYLPRGWEDLLALATDDLARREEEWGVLGVYGVQQDARHVGRAWSTGLRREYDARTEQPEPVVSIDELAFVLNRRAGLEFDPELPGFHLYGTDIVQTSLQRGFGAFVFHGPVIHNSTPVRRLRSDYWRAHRYLARKWRDRLPIPTNVVDIPASSWMRMRLAWNLAKKRMRRLLGGSTRRNRLADPVQKARELAYE